MQTTVLASLTKFEENPAPDIMELRAKLVRTIKLDDIHRMEKDELLLLQRKIGLGSDWGRIEFPKSWMAPGTCSQLSYRRINIAEALSSVAQSPAELEHAICGVVRITLLCILSPVYTSQNTTYLMPASIAQNARRHVELAAAALCKTILTPGRIFERISLSELAGTNEDKKRQQIELKRLYRFAERGLWSDIGAIGSRASEPPSPVGPKQKKKSPKKSAPFLPFNDKFTAAAGYRVAWIIEVLGPALIECGHGLQKICRDFPIDGQTKKKKNYQQARRTDEAKKYLANFSWKDPDGNPIVVIPFEMHFSGMGKSGKFKWPVRTLAQARMLLRILQSAHLFVFLISTGGRISEALSLQPGCIVETADGVPLSNGRTYKLTFRVGGVERDWPLPELGVYSVRQQEELAKLILDVSPDEDNQKELDKLESIWTREGGNGERIDGEYNKYLKNIVKVFGLTEEFGEGAMHAHRFRKTIARLMALAVVGAPKILMDLFGHRHIEMTLHYILADPTIRAEMIEVARAQTIMLAKDVIVEADTCGGPAAGAIKAAVEAERHRMGRDFGEDSLQSLAETFTLNGKHWQLVRPGVICTKGPQVAGACTPSTSMPEPSRCRTKCDYRLEMAFQKDDIDRRIGDAVKRLEEAIKNEDEIGMEMWTGQILSNITTFDELRKKWEAHPIVAKALNNSTVEI